jgi:septal ring factor EnvC (AmiA/AmiB activator)
MAHPLYFSTQDQMKMHPNPLFEAQAKLQEANRQRDCALERCQNIFAEGGQRIAELEAQVKDLEQQIATLKSNTPVPQEATDGDRNN